MESKQKHTYAEVLDGLLNNQSYFLDYIKSTDFDDDALAGLKLFLENNKYNIQLLKQFTEPPPLTLKPSKQKHIGNYYKIAAGIVLIISVGLLVKFSLSNKASAINHYWIEDPGFKVWMGPTDKSMFLQNGMSYYRAKDYKAALDQFVSIAQNDTAMYYSGICFIKLNKMDSAINHLLLLPQTSVYKNKSMYYLVLSYLYNNKTNEALNILNTTIFNTNEMAFKKKLILKEYSTK